MLICIEFVSSWISCEISLWEIHMALALESWKPCFFALVPLVLMVLPIGNLKIELFIWFHLEHEMPSHLKPTTKLCSSKQFSACAAQCFHNKMQFHFTKMFKPLQISVSFQWHVKCLSLIFYDREWPIWKWPLCRMQCFGFGLPHARCPNL